MYNPNTCKTVFHVLPSMSWKRFLMIYDQVDDETIKGKAHTLVRTVVSNNDNEKRGLFIILVSKTIQTIRIKSYIDS